MDLTSAFQSAAGESWLGLAVLIAGLGCTLALLWAAWAYVSTFRGWSATRVRAGTAGGATVRILLVVLLLFWLFLS